MELKYRRILGRAEDYARANHMDSFLSALVSLYRIFPAYDSETTSQQEDLQRCLLGINMLMDLHADVTPAEEETMLTAAVLSMTKDHLPGEREPEKTPVYPTDVTDLLEILLTDPGQTDEEQQVFYRRIRENKLALLILLADRGILLQQLHRFSTRNARYIISETRTVYLPMSIYGKEHYHELLAPISILTEKMRSLSEAAEILLDRYESREEELIQDIMALQEENATIRGIIASFRQQ